MDPEEAECTIDSNGWLIFQWLPHFQFPAWEEDILSEVQGFVFSDNKELRSKGRGIFESVVVEFVEMLALGEEENRFLLMICKDLIFLSHLGRSLDLPAGGDESVDQESVTELLLELVGRIESEEKARSWVGRVLRAVWEHNPTFLEDLRSSLDTREELLTSISSLGF